MNDRHGDYKHPIVFDADTWELNQLKNKETDPTGKIAGEKGAKLDCGKNRLSLVLGSFAPALWEVGKVGTFGAEKYTDDGWQSVPNRLQRYEDAMLRHWAKIHMGEEKDQDSGLLHAAHLAWNALAILYATLENKNADTKLDTIVDSTRLRVTGIPKAVVADTKK